MDLTEETKKGLKAMNITHLSHIQKDALPPALAGRDVLGTAKTGSGKTLAFLIPCVEKLAKLRFQGRNGTGVIIISPTRELALQIYSNARELMQFHKQSHGIIMGGANRRMEAEKLMKGVNLVVATPGRLLDHLQSTHRFAEACQNLQLLVIDEADRCLEIGFEREMMEIVKILKTKASPQTLLFSATNVSTTENIRELAKLALNENPVEVNTRAHETTSTVCQLEQGFVICPSESRFLLLYTFLRKNVHKKIMVFFSSCNACKFYAELLNYIDVPCMELHGRQKQQKRTSTFFEFCHKKEGILLSTDVAARGLDIPEVDWIIQFDPPDDPKEYIHRVGRTARGTQGKGRALLFVLPQEVGFLHYLREAKIPLNEYDFPVSKVAKVGAQLENLIAKNYYLNRSSRDAYRSYLQAYASHSLKNIFDVYKLDLLMVAKSFGFTTPPRVELNLKATGKKVQKRGGGGGYGDPEAVAPKLSITMGARDRRQQMSKKKNGGDKGHGFSASNPYGSRQGGDRRQFAH
nr:ATP-dependent RNA helicase [Paratrimastix eleionoma]